MGLDVLDRNEARLVDLLTELEQSGWIVWFEVTDSGNILAMIRSPIVDILLPDL